jgi:hypothetical protein
MSALAKSYKMVGAEFTSSEGNKANFAFVSVLTAVNGAEF